ncbi:MAG: hypothetical protein M1610_07955 [Nitrospirae bacterium]|nr:hypothetical protein [Nitrospirota bacterium]MDA8215366.1 hypothetical protein [Nitrospiraceae bacterium]MDA8337874.1 hypothetical protein [Nitrospiraceae bacterium]
MFKLKVLAICALAVVVLFSGIALAQDDTAQKSRENIIKERIMGFGSGTGFGSGGGFGSSMGINGFGGSMSSRGSMNAGHGFGSGFRSGTGSGPMSSGDAWSTGSTNMPQGGWKR